jgi:ABC-2 type transport system permease protein
MLATVVTKTMRDRWKGTVIGAVTVGLLLGFGMAVYRDIDLSFYQDLPEAYRTLVNIPADADVGSLAYGGIYSTYGALTLAAIALVAGATSVAGEERNGTLGLLLGNPKSRTAILISKAASMVLLSAVASLILWGAGVLTPELLNVDISGTHVGALVFHMFVNALFYGFLAMAIGAWTGKTATASGVTAGVMVVSFFAAGLLPIVGGLESGAKAFPWYYYQGGDPVFNGIDWGHLAVLLAASTAFVIAAVVGVRRRDLRNQTVGVTLVDRLRSNPLTTKVVDRLAGSTRVSRIWIKTASEHQVLLIVTAYVMFLLMGLLIGPMYALLDESILDLADQFPETLLALFGGGDMGTPEGFYQVETFGLMAPIAVMVVAVAIAAKALAGEEEKRTMGLLLANPIKRSTIVLEKAWAMVAYAAAVGFATFAGVALGSVVGGLGMSIVNIAATCLLVTLVGLLFGALALAVGAGSGRVRAAIFVAAGAALALHVVNALFSINDRLAGWAKWSPFYYYLGNDPLVNGMHWGHASVLAATIAALVGLSVYLFDRRDLRQTG